ncbi:MAG: hypothetical protein HY908_10430 [Myxococcales bacterium]|nr:hypothetical protein [Myxococcales bacterium]
MRLLPRPLACLAVAWLLAAGARPARAENPADIAAARELFQEGTAAAEAGRWQEAVDRFTRSLALKQAPLTVYSLGVAQKKTGRLAWALENFRAFLAEPATPTTEPYRPAATEAVAELDKRVAYVAISFAPPQLSGLVVTLDGEPVPLVALDRPRLVDPGDHVLEADATGYDAARATFKVLEGETADVQLVLPPTTHLEPSPWLGASLFAVGGSAAVVGVALGLAGVSQASSAPTRDGPEATAARNKAVAGDVTAGIGVAVATTGLIVLLADLVGDDEDEPPVASTAAVRPWSGGGANGLELRF